MSTRNRYAIRPHSSDAHMSRLLVVQTPREPHEPDFLMLSGESSRPDSCNAGVEVFA